MYNRLSIRQRLWLLVLGPIALVIGIGLWQSASATATASEADRVVDQVTATAPAMAFVHELQTERDVAILGLSSGDTSSFDDQTARTDAAGAELAESLIDGVDAELSALVDVRAAVLGGSSDLIAVTKSYDGLIDGITGTVGATMLDAGADPVEVSPLLDLQTAKRAAAEQRSVLLAGLASGSLEPGTAERLAELEAVEATALERFAVTRPAIAAPLRGSADAVDELRLQILAADAEAVAIDAATWRAVADEHLDALRGAEVEAVQAVIDDAAAAAGEASSARLVVLAVAAVLIAALVGGALTLGRSITRPIAELAGLARKLAAEDLPDAVAAAADPLAPQPRLEPIRVDTGGEVAELAAALETARSTSVKLAREQADLRLQSSQTFANLGRRNHNLISRQLGLIDALESEEQDPDRLDRMFQLDHLASRMKRNAESLMVMAGEHAGREASEPMPLVDVVRSSLSAIEDYTRASIRNLEPVELAPGAVADVVHIVAELLENGTHFSPPSTQVEIFGGWYEESYLVAVVDHGMGMTPDQLEAANQRIRAASTSAATAAAGRSLGFDVIGRLAGRQGLNVRLSPTQNGGVTAAVALPPTLVTTVSPATHAGLTMDSMPSAAMPGAAPMPGAAAVPGVSSVAPSIPTPAPMPQPVVEAPMPAPQPVAQTPMPAPAPAPAPATQPMGIAPGELPSRPMAAAVPPMPQAHIPTPAPAAPQPVAQATPPLPPTTVPTGTGEFAAATSPDASMPTFEVPDSPAPLSGGLVARVPGQNLPQTGGRATPHVNASPDEVRSLFGDLQAGVEQGRASLLDDEPTGLTETYMPTHPDHGGLR